MDPHIHPRQPGLQEDSTGDEGVSYLRRLRSDGDGAPAPAAAMGGSTGPASAPAVDWTTRRQSPRLRCSGSVEFRPEGSDVRLWGTLTDVSLHGCYVEMNTTFPAGTKVDLVLKSCGIRIQAVGTVRTSYPFLGMGICFGEIEAEQLSPLKELLGALAGRNAVSNGGSAPDNGVKDALASANARAFLDEITEFFRKSRLLSREEFLQIAKRVRQR